MAIWYRFKSDIIPGIVFVRFYINNLLSVKKIALFGEWNTSNLGDTSIGISNSELILDLGYEVELFSFGSLSYLGSVASKNEAVVLFDKIRPKARHTYVPKAISPLRRIIRKRKFFWSAIQFSRSCIHFIKTCGRIRSAHGIVVGGGELLNNRHFQFATALFLITKAAQITKTPLICLGSSTPENLNRSGRRIVKKFIEHSQLIATRDIHTKELLESLVSKEIDIYGDCAMRLINGKNFISPTILKKRVGLNIKSEKVHEIVYKRFLTQIVNQLNQNNISCILFTTGTLEDNLALERFKTEWEQKYTLSTFVPTSLSELSAFLGTLDFTVCSRLHAAILSFNENTPAIGISTNQKLFHFYQTIGIEDYSFKILLKKDSEECIELIHKMINLKGHFEANIGDLINRRKRILKVLKELLSAKS